MNVSHLFQRLSPHHRVITLAAAPVLLGLIAGIYLLVFATGGIKYVYSHSMYLPILLGGLVFGARGGIVLGLLGGVALGPFMPIDVATGEMQNTANWLYRTGFFTLIGICSGVASDAVRSHIRHLGWVARHDAVTRLPNRDALIAALADIARKGDVTIPRVLAIISFENVVELKTAFGIDVVEEIMRQSAERLQTSVQGQFSVYRTGTEQIAQLFHTSAEIDMDGLIALLVETMRQPFLFNNIPIHADSRVGYVTFTAFTERPEQYLENAEAASVMAHQQDRDCVAYTPSITGRARENLSLLGELMNGVNGGQLSLHFQPKVAIRTGEVCGAEALMRWNHPQRGSIPPGVFIPRAEQSTLIHMITEFALKRALEQVVQWRQQSIYIPVAVNVSPRNLLQPGFSALVLRLLDHYGLDGAALEIEITEGALMTDMAPIIVELKRLADNNITTSIDDFGTGYSSLQYLHRLPISQIKIDQSFVQRLAADQSAMHIVDAAISVARRMGIKTVAEGVESTEIYDLLGDLGCDIAQGYAIARPMPAVAFSTWFMTHASATPARRQRHLL